MKTERAYPKITVTKKAEAALAEARRLKEEAEAQLAAAQNQAAAEKQEDGAEQ